MLEDSCSFEPRHWKKGGRRIQLFKREKKYIDMQKNATAISQHKITTVLPHGKETSPAAIMMLPAKTSGPKLLASSPVRAKPQKTAKMLSHCWRFKRRLRFDDNPQPSRKATQPRQVAVAAAARAVLTKWSQKRRPLRKWSYQP